MDTISESLPLYIVCHLQDIDEIPDDIKALYKTVWEMPQKTLVDMAADRGAFVDQSQSFNVFIAAPNYGKLTSMHFYGWKKVTIKEIPRGDTMLLYVNVSTTVG